MSSCNYSLSALISNLHPQHPPFFLLSAPLHLWMSGEPRPHTCLCMKSNIYSVMELLLKWPPALRSLGGDLANEIIMTCGKKCTDSLLGARSELLPPAPGTRPLPSRQWNLGVDQEKKCAQKSCQWIAAGTKESASVFSARRCDGVLEAKTGSRKKENRLLRKIQLFIFTTWILFLWLNIPKA